MYKFIRSILFLFPAEFIHKITTGILSVVARVGPGKWLLKFIFGTSKHSSTKEVFGILFPNPVGLAAGFDKDADLVDAMACVGFGFVEIGTVTPKAQSGNEKPRLFRLPKDRALINRMGFNNHGVASAVANLKRRKTKIIVGGNIGKNKLTPNEEAASDYLICFEQLFPYVDYFVVNVSSPNTPGLRALQEKGPLKELLSALMKANNLKSSPKPILLKIAPDLTTDQVDEILEIVEETKLAGLVAANTTISRENLLTIKSSIEKIGAGGLSGSPLRKQSISMVAYISAKTKGKLPIIGVGGIMCAEDAKDLINAGAWLVQIYTGFIYEGPALVSKIINALPVKESNNHKD